MICTICQEDKDPSNFRTQKSTLKSGVKWYHLSSCKTCNQKKSAEWRRQHADDPAVIEARRTYNRTYREKMKNDPAKVARKRECQHAYRVKIKKVAAPKSIKPVVVQEGQASQVCFLCAEEKPMTSFRSRMLKTGSISHETRCKQCCNQRDRQVKRQMNPESNPPVDQESIPQKIEFQPGMTKWERLKADPVRYEAYLIRQRKRDRNRYKAKWEAIKNNPEKMEAYRQKAREKTAIKKQSTDAFEPIEPIRKAPVKRKKNKRKAKRSGGSISSWLHKMAQQQVANF